MEDNVFVCLKTIADMQNENVEFYVDAYQRGYRWTSVEVKDLLNDIREFSETDYAITNKYYCLQPIIITNKDGKYKVVDGQQRLTTLYLIYAYYINTAGKRRQLKEPFKISYRNKPVLTNCINDILKYEVFTESDLKQLDAYKKDIDCYFVLNAYGTICDYFNALYDNPHTQDDGDKMRMVFNSYMKIIWYELIDCNETKEKTMFSKINVGKIPLTNAELIKALILRSDDNIENTIKADIALKWNDIESQFSNDNFWSFLVNNQSEYTTRIDYLFDVVSYEINEFILKEHEKADDYYVIKDSNIKYFSFYVISNYIKMLKTDNGETRPVEVLWNRIIETYRMLLDWYKNRKWYHMIGYLISDSGNQFVKKAYELSSIYRNNNTDGLEKGRKSFFESHLRELMRSSINSGKIHTVAEMKDYVDSLEYGKKNGAIKQLLVLYNICSLEILESKTDARFPFEKYKNKEVSWDIEHINAVADDIPNDDRDVDDNSRKLWLENAHYVRDDLLTINGNNVKQLISNILQTKRYLPKNDDSLFVEVYDAIINDFNEISEPNSIGNLTLLDSGTNRSYKNDIFPKKRQTILEKCYSEVYIPLCTKNVFLKAYADSDNLLKWTQADCDGYMDDIVNVVSAYLQLQGE